MILNYNMVKHCELFYRRRRMDRLMKANAELSKFSRNYMELKRNLPIRPSEMGVLNIITQMDGPHTPMQLAQLLGVSKPMIAAHVSALEKKGYIERLPSASDKRSFYILPTQSAKDLAERAKRDMQDQLGLLTERLGRHDFDELIRLITIANLALEDYRKRERGDTHGFER